MSDPRILLCGSALTADKSSSGLDMMRAVSLADATKVLVTTGKFDTQKEARAFNIEAGYPAETALLQTLSRWAEVPKWPDIRFRDGYDLFCLQRILGHYDGFDIAVLLRDGSGFEARRASLLRDLGDGLFLTTDTGEGAANLLIRVADPRAEVFLDRAVQFYVTGRAYALEPYDLVQALTLAARTVELEFGFGETIENDSGRPGEGSALAQANLVASG